MKFLVKLLFRMAIFVTLFMLLNVILCSTYHTFSYAANGLSDLFVRKGHSFDQSLSLVLNGLCQLVVAVYHGVLTFTAIILTHHKVWSAYKSETGRGDKRLAPLLRLAGCVVFAYIAIIPWYFVPALAAPTIYWVAITMIVIDFLFLSFATSK